MVDDNNSREPQSEPPAEDVNFDGSDRTNEAGTPESSSPGEGPTAGEVVTEQDSGTTEGTNAPTTTDRNGDDQTEQPMAAAFDGGPPNDELVFKCQSDGFVDGGLYGRVEFVRNRTGEVVAVVFQRTTRTDPIPQEMREIGTKANAIVMIIRRRFGGSTHDTETWLELLCTSCRIGVVGPNPDPQAGLAGLGRLEELLIQAARPIRQDYITKLFKVFVIISAISVVLYAALDWFDSSELYASLFSSSTLAAGITDFALVQLMTIVGLSLGVLFSGLVQNQVISVQTLMSFDPDGFSSRERHIFVWAVATTVEVLMIFNVITFSVGSVAFSELQSTPKYGILLGLAVALSTEIVVGLVSRSTTPTEQPNSAT